MGASRCPSIWWTAIAGLFHAIASERPNGRPYQNGANQTRTRGIRDAVDVIFAQSRLLQCGLDQRDRLANMIPAGELGDNATVVRMQLDLAV